MRRTGIAVVAVVLVAAGWLWLHTKQASGREQRDSGGEGPLRRG